MSARKALRKPSVRTRADGRGLDSGAHARRGEPRGGRRPRRRRPRAVREPARAPEHRRHSRGRPAAVGAPGRQLRDPPASSSRTRLDGRRERLVYFSREGDLAAYEELRSGFTAAVSHELRTPLARLLTLLETATLPGEDVVELVEQATREVEQITELIDEILFLSELESGARVVSLGPTPVRPVLEEALDELAERASRAGVELRLECRCGRRARDQAADAPRAWRATWPRTRSATPGPGTTFTLGAAREDATVGRLVGSRRRRSASRQSSLPRLFERFYRADRARASRGTGLGLAIVKHIVTQAGGTVEARGGRGTGLEIRCTFVGLDLAPASPDFHRMFTSRRPADRNPQRKTGAHGTADGVQLSRLGGRLRWSWSRPVRGRRRRRRRRSRPTARARSGRSSRRPPRTSRPSRTSTSPSGSRAPAAGSSASARARPISRMRRARSTRTSRCCATTAASSTSSFASPPTR